MIMQIDDFLAALSDDVIKLMSPKETKARHEAWRRRMNARLQIRFIRKRALGEHQKLLTLLESWGPAWNSAAQSIRERMESLKNDESR